MMDQTVRAASTGRSPNSTYAQRESILFNVKQAGANLDRRAKWPQEYWIKNLS